MVTTATCVLLGLIFGLYAGQTDELPLLAVVFSLLIASILCLRTVAIYHTVQFQVIEPETG